MGLDVAPNTQFLDPTVPVCCVIPRRACALDWPIAFRSVRALAPFRVWSARVAYGRRRQILGALLQTPAALHWHGPEWGSSTPCDHPLETRGAGRGWRDRLASTKALLTVGTESACREALGILHTFIDAATDTDAPLLTHDDTLELVFGPVELRLCAQCLVLALRVCSKEALLWRRLSPSGLLTRALEQCATCATNSALQQLMLTSGVIAVLVPLLNDHARNAADTTNLLLPALKTICSLAGWRLARRNERRSAATAHHRTFTAAHRCSSR